ncbi:MAG: dockerin type I domain-containing protein [Pirellulaceae bacterium]|nr:dockerin type I domain-containing protein [Pirellulaceae bacterium]
MDNSIHGVGVWIKPSKNMRRRNSSQSSFTNRRSKMTRRQRVRKLTFDSLEDRRLLAGLNIFVYDDVNQSGTWESASESSLAEQVVYIDGDDDGHLGPFEQYAVTDADGKAVIDNLSFSIAKVRLFGATAPPQGIPLPNSNAFVDVNMASKASPGNHAPVLNTLATKVVDEDFDLSLAISLFANVASDVDNDPLVFFVVGQPTNGSLYWSIEAGGIYAPNANFNGVDTISFRAFDGKAWSSEVSLSITVNSIDDRPTSVEFDGSSIPENELGYAIGTVTIIDVDGGPNTIELSPSSLFVLNNGVLSLAPDIALDFEATPTLDISIAISVDGIQLHDLTRDYVIAVVDRNDPPVSLVFEGQPLVEEFIAGFEFGTIKVTDQDVGDTYRFVVSDNRFIVADGKLALKSSVSLFYSDAQTVPVTVTAESLTNSDKISETIEIQVVRAAPPWQNKHWPLDVNDDGILSPTDVLVVINALNRLGNAPLDRPPPPGSPTFVDVNGDRFLSPIDVLILINALNRQSRGDGQGPDKGGGGGVDGGEGEAPATPQNLGTESKSLSSQSAVNVQASTPSIDHGDFTNDATRKSSRRTR